MADTVAERYFDGAAPPPTRQEETCRQVVWAREGKPLRLVLTGERVRVVPCHWVDGGSFPCFGPDGGCRHCLVEEARWQGALAAWDRALGADVVFFFPGPVATQLAELAAANGGLRGLEVDVSTHGRGKRRAYRVQLVGTHGPESRLRAGFDVGPTLARVMGVRELPRPGGKGVRP